MAGKWFTTQIRVRQATHEYLIAQARANGISIGQAAGVILEYAARQGWEIGPVTVTRQPSAIVTRLDAGQQQDTTRS
jgi:hypothetical protein